MLQRSIFSKIIRIEGFEKMRYKRSERIVFMTQYLMNHPNKLIPLTFFVKKFKQAKSSISEDVQIIKNTFQKEQLGTVITTAGASASALLIIGL